MDKKLTELVFILDRSGSMAGLEDDTIGGYNAMIKKQKEEDGEANVTTILFDDRIETLHERISIQNIKPMTDREYNVRGCTALLDAIGRTISYMMVADNAAALKNESSDPRAFMWAALLHGVSDSICKLGNTNAVPCKVFFIMFLVFFSLL